MEKLSDEIFLFMYVFSWIFFFGNYLGRDSGGGGVIGCGSGDEGW